MSFNTGAWQEADIKINGMNSLQMLSEGKDCQKIIAEAIYYAVFLTEFTSSNNPNKFTSSHNTKPKIP